MVVSNLLLALAMVAFVGVPFARAVWSGAGQAESNVEKRELAGLPAFPTTSQTWIEFPKAFDSYAHDQFGFRDDLLQGYRWLMGTVFHQSTSFRAFVGRNGWLYYTGDGSLADMQGTSAYTDAQLRNAVEQINARGELLAVRGIRYGFVVFPDKHTVYPQFLPPGVYAGFEHRRLNALDDAMAETGRDYYFDATDALRRDAAHSPFPLYYKSDTHWNPWGAYLGYQAWVATSGSRLDLRQFDYRFDQFRNPHRSRNGDLAKMSGYRPDDPEILPPTGAGCPSSAAWPVSQTILQRLGVTTHFLNTTGCDGQGIALILHDSFMDFVQRYVTSSFKKSYLVWDRVDDENFGWLVGKVHPDVVVVERVERMMDVFQDADIAALLKYHGVVGETAIVGEQGDLVVGSHGNRKALARQAVSGAIDRVVRDGSRIHVDGWARVGKSSPAAVIAVLDGIVVGEAPVTFYRPAVAAANHDELAWSGFRLNLPAEALSRGSSALRLYCVDFDSYGEFVLNPPDRQRLARTYSKSR